MGFKAMTDTAELIARLRNLDCNGPRPLFLAAAAALTTQAQQIADWQASSEAYRKDAETAEARVRDVETECEQLRERIINRDAQIAAIEAKTFTETRERCAQIADHYFSGTIVGDELHVNETGAHQIAAAIRTIHYDE